MRDAASGRIGIVQMDAVLRYTALARRAVQQLLKATRRLSAAEQALTLPVTATTAAMTARAEVERLVREARAALDSPGP